MEYPYFLIDDCCHSISELLNMHYITSFSSIAKKYRSFVFNVKYIHSTIRYRAYHKFHNLRYLYLSNINDPQYLSHLTNLRRINICANENVKFMLSSLTNLIEIETLQHFNFEIYSNLTSLQNLRTNTLHNIELYLQLTRLKVGRLCDHVSKLSLLTKLNNLSCSNIDSINLSLLSNLKYLEVYNISNLKLINSPLHFAYISECDQISIINCTQLKYLSIFDWTFPLNLTNSFDSCIVNSYNIKRLIIHKFICAIDINFDSFVNLENLSLSFIRSNCKVYLTSRLSKLQKLDISACQPEIDSLICNNLKKLDYMIPNGTLNFLLFANLTYLCLHEYAVHVGLSSLNKLQFLDIYTKQFIDFQYHTNLLSANISNFRRTNNITNINSLIQLTRLKMIESDDIFVSDSLRELCSLRYLQIEIISDFNLFVNDLDKLNNLTDLITLCVSNQLISMRDKTLDMKLLSGLTSLKRMRVNMRLKNVCMFTNLDNLNVCVPNEQEYFDEISVLIKLKYLNIVCQNDNICKLNLKNCTDLIYYKLVDQIGYDKSNDVILPDHLIKLY